MELDGTFIVRPDRLVAFAAGPRDTGDENIDVAFVPHFDLGTPGPTPFVTEGIRARQIVAQHYEYTTAPANHALIQQNYPTAILFHQPGETQAIQ